MLGGVSRGALGVEENGDVAACHRMLDTTQASQMFDGSSATAREQSFPIRDWILTSLKVTIQSTATSLFCFSQCCAFSLSTTTCNPVIHDPCYPQHIYPCLASLHHIYPSHQCVVHQHNDLTPRPLFPETTPHLAPQPPFPCHPPISRHGLGHEHSETELTRQPGSEAVRKALFSPLWRRLGSDVIGSCMSHVGEAV